MSKFYCDLDGYAGVVVEPSPQRVRNILTLEERVRAIHAYDKRPMYTKVAKMFNCSWEQIKNIVANRDTILEFYEATRNVKKTDDPDRDEIRKRKLAYLGECMYEYIQRAQFHRHTDLNEDLLRTKALEFRDLIEIDKFVPNKSWINHFKATYNISLSNRQITLTRIPPDSLDLKDIMTYCGKKKSHNDELVIVPTAIQKSGQAGQVPTPTPSESERSLYRTKTRVEVSLANEAALEMVELRRRRKINFLEHALYEYLQRATFHQKVPADYDRIRDVAIQLLNILKIERFFPDRTWLKHFKNRFNFSLSQGVLVKDRTPPLSLDLRDILSYCRRNDRHQPPAPVTLTPKENSAFAALREKMRSDASKATKSKSSSNKLARSMNESAMIETNYQSDDDDVIVVEGKQELIVIKDDDENENENDDVVLSYEDQDADECNPPPLKIQKIETLNSSLSNDKHPLSPGHWSEHSGDNDPDAQEPLPNIIRNYKDALRLLKPLEEFAMLEENYRVIGLISQLEDIFTNPPKINHSDHSHEDYDSNL